MSYYLISKLATMQHSIQAIWFGVKSCSQNFPRTPYKTTQLYDEKKAKNETIVTMSAVRSSSSSSSFLLFLDLAPPLDFRL